MTMNIRQAFLDDAKNGCFQVAGQPPWIGDLAPGRPRSCCARQSLRQTSGSPSVAPSRRAMGDATSTKSSGRHRKAGGPTRRQSRPSGPGPDHGDRLPVAVPQRSWKAVPALGRCYRATREPPGGALRPAPAAAAKKDRASLGWKLPARWPAADLRVLLLELGRSFPQGMFGSDALLQLRHQPPEIHTRNTTTTRNATNATTPVRRAKIWARFWRAPAGRFLELQPLQDFRGLLIRRIGFRSHLFLEGRIGQA